MAAVIAQSYSPAEEAEIQQWLTTSERLSKPEAETFPILDALNAHLASRTTLLGTKPSQADMAIYKAVAPIVKSWTPEQRTGEKGHPHVMRHVDFVQNAYDVFGLEVPKAEKVSVNPEEILYVHPSLDAKAERERLKKKAAAAAAAENQVESRGLVNRTKDAAPKMKDKAAAAVGAPAEKQKKEKDKTCKKQPATLPTSAVLSPCLIDLRVGHILKAIKHPEADSLYVSSIAVGDAPGTDDTSNYEGQVVRTVCSGLNGLVPLEEMQGRKVVVVCNLKPVKMRGIKSCAMVLAASPKPVDGTQDDHKGPVELVDPPVDARPGERVFFEGWKGEPERVLNPKKKVWETFQPAFTTTSDLEVAFDAGAAKLLEGKHALAKLVTENGGVCKVNSLAGATVR